MNKALIQLCTINGVDYTKVTKEIGIDEYGYVLVVVNGMITRLSQPHIQYPNRQPKIVGKYTEVVENKTETDLIKDENTNHLNVNNTNEPSDKTDELNTIVINDSPKHDDIISNTSNNINLDLNNTSDESNIVDENNNGINENSLDLNKTSDKSNIVDDANTNLNSDKSTDEKVVINKPKKQGKSKTQ